MSALAPFATKNSPPKNDALPKRREGLGITTVAGSCLLGMTHVPALPER
jgi:hypothetical protein